MIAFELETPGSPWKRLHPPGRVEGTEAQRNQEGSKCGNGTACASMRSGFCTVTKRDVKVFQEPYSVPYVRFCERADAAPDQCSVTLLDSCL